MAFKIGLRPLVLLGPLLALALWAAPAAGQMVYFTPRAVLADFFPHSRAVTYRRIDLSPEARVRLERRIGQPLRKATFTVYVAQTGDAVDGYAVIDDEPGEHQPITFAVKFSPAGVVQRQEILVYRERFGDEVRDERFRRQFVGKTVADPLRPGEDVVAVSGATISSRSMAIGVRRALVLLDELVLQPQRVRSAAAPAPARPVQ